MINFEYVEELNYLTDIDLDADIVQVIVDYPLVKERIHSAEDIYIKDYEMLSAISPFGKDIVEMIIEEVTLDSRKKFLRRLLEENPYIEEQGKGTQNFINIADNIKNSTLSQRGLTLKNGKYRVNFNQFVRYFLTRIYLYKVGSDFIAYDIKRGLYTPIDEDCIKMQAKTVLHEAEADIWETPYGAKLMEQLRIDTKVLKSIPKEDGFINLKNGILSLRKFNLMRHTEKYISTTQLPVVYNEDARCPHFLKYLDTVFGSDRDLIALVQEIFGYSLTVDTNLQKFFIFYGTGGNGKSVLATIMRKVIGEDNCSSATLEQLSDKFGAQVIKNKRLNISGESDSSRAALNTQQLKLITGEDRIQVEVKFKDPFMIRPYVKLVVLSNHYPRTHDNSEGFLRRCVFIPFNTRFVDKGSVLKSGQAYKDPNLMSKLESELDGIFLWAIQGYKRLIESGGTLTQCEASDRLLRDFIIWNNPIKQFISERLTTKEGGRLIKGDVYLEYNTWCKENNVGHGSQVSTKEFWIKFSESVEGIIEGYQYKLLKSNSKRYVLGLAFQ